MNKVIVLEGNMAEREGVMKKIKDSFTDFYDTIIFDKNDNYDYVSQSLTEMSCFVENKLFIMKEFPQIEAPNEAQGRIKILNRFKKLFPSIPFGNVLVLNNIGISGESFLKEVKKYGEVYKFKQKINKSEGNRIVNSYFKDKNILINHEVSQLLVNSLNLNGDEVDIDKLHLATIKFYHYVYGKRKITKEDVYLVCSFSKDFIIWSLYNILDDISLSEKKYAGSAISVINNYLENVKYFKHEAIMIIRGMIWRYGLLLLAKNGANNKTSQKEINQQISNICKLESHGKSYRIKMIPKMLKDTPVQEYSSKVIDSVMNDYYGRASLSCYNYNQLLLIYYTLVKIMLKIRVNCTKSEIKIALSIIVFVICGIITKQNTIDGVLEHNKISYGIGK